MPVTRSPTDNSMVQCKRRSCEATIWPVLDKPSATGALQAMRKIRAPLRHLASAGDAQQSASPQAQEEACVVDLPTLGPSAAAHWFRRCGLSGAPVLGRSPGGPTPRLSSGQCRSRAGRTARARIHDQSATHQEPSGGHQESPRRRSPLATEAVGSGFQRARQRCADTDGADRAGV
jgi:hypothetical protein